MSFFFVILAGVIISLLINNYEVIKWFATSESLTLAILVLTALAGSLAGSIYITKTLLDMKNQAYKRKRKADDEEYTEQEAYNITADMVHHRRDGT